MMYGFGSTPGSRPRSPAMAGGDEHRAQPQRHPRVEAALEQIEGERTGRDEEHENPDRPVVESVIELVALADLSMRRVLDGNACHERVGPQGAARGRRGSRGLGLDVGGFFAFAV